MKPSHQILPPPPTFQPPSASIDAILVSSRIRESTLHRSTGEQNPNFEGAREKYEEQLREWEKEKKILCEEKLETLLEELLEIKNQVIKKFKEEREKHQEERCEWEREEKS